MTWVSVGVTVGGALLGGVGARKQKKRDDASAAQAEGVERERQQQIEATQAQIDAAYGSKARQQQYGTYANALREFYGTALNKKKLDASRLNKFGLAKQGLIGSSVQADRTKRLGDEFADAALQNERGVQGALADLKNRDEASRIALRGEAREGLQLNQAGLRASEAQRQDIGTADVAARAKGIGDVFSDTLASYKAAKDRQLLAGGYSAARQNLWGAPPGR